MVSRRDWLKLSLVAGAALRCGRSPDDEPLNSDCAVATFEVDSNSAIIAAYARRPGSAMVVVDGPDGERDHGPLMLSRDAGNTGSALLDGLAADTAYRYRLEFDDGTVSSWHQLRTAPAADQEHEFSLLYSADIDVSAEFDSPIFDTMAASGAAFFVCLGDWPYADNPPGAETLEQFRARHKQARAAAKVQRLLRAMPAYAIYDDHEVWNNWDGGFRTRNPAQVAAGLRAWDEWFPLRDTGADKKRYRSWRWGKHAELFLLDTRLYRDANDAPDGPQKTMLGATQKQWLLDGLAASDATFKLVLTSVPLDIARPLAPYPDDHWGVFADERDQLLAHVRDHDIAGVLYLTADQHWFAAHHFAAGHIEFQVGPLARGLFEPPPPTSEVVATAVEYNYGELVFTSGPPPAVTFNCRGASGQLLYTETITAG